MYLQSNSLLLVDVFENFRNMCLEIYELDPAKFLSTPELAWLTALKKTKEKLDQPPIPQFSGNWSSNILR